MGQWPLRVQWAKLEEALCSGSGMHGTALQLLWQSKAYRRGLAWGAKGLGAAMLAAIWLSIGLQASRQAVHAWGCRQAGSA